MAGLRERNKRAQADRMMWDRSSFGGTMSSATNNPGAFVAAPAVPATQVETRTVPVAWYIWAGVIAVTSSSIGGAWDVSWHRSIGRDTFWTPAHMAIYACGVIGAIVCAWLVMQCTFGRDEPDACGFGEVCWDCELR